MLQRGSPGWSGQPQPHVPLHAQHPDVERHTRVAVVLFGRPPQVAKSAQHAQRVGVEALLLHAWFSRPWMSPKHSGAGAQGRQRRVRAPDARRRSQVGVEAPPLVLPQHFAEAPSLESRRVVHLQERRIWARAGWQAWARIQSGGQRTHREDALTTTVLSPLAASCVTAANSSPVPRWPATRTNASASKAGAWMCSSNSSTRRRCALRRHAAAPRAVAARVALQRVFKGPPELT